MATSSKQRKPAKPNKSFPLTAHNNGQWCKKIHGKIHFFGVWADPHGAQDRYLRVAADLHAGRQPKSTSLSEGSLTVKDACNQFLTHQQGRVEVREIAGHWFDACRRTAADFAKFVGLDRIVDDISPVDFEAYRRHLACNGLTNGKGLGVYALERSTMIVKALFAHAYDMELIDRPINFGKAFKGPSAAAKRKSRSQSRTQNGDRLFEPSEITAMLEVAGIPLHAMILLGINGGFGSTDCARLPRPAIRLDKAVIEFPRPKTGIERVVPLWPETLDSLKRAIASRPSPVDESSEETKDLVFLTTFGRSWVRSCIRRGLDGKIGVVTRTDAVGEEFDKLLVKLGLKRRRLGFYALRHTFRTWADEVRDQHAIHRIMGHTIPGMSGIYIEAIGLDRLVAVTEHVRKKLFGELAISGGDVSGAVSSV